MRKRQKKPRLKQMSASGNLCRGPLAPYVPLMSRQTQTLPWNLLLAKFERPGKKLGRLNVCVCVSEWGGGTSGNGGLWAFNKPTQKGMPKKQAKTHARTRAHTHTHTRPPARPPARTHPPTHTHTHTLIHVHTRTHAQHLALRTRTRTFRLDQGRVPKVDCLSSLKGSTRSCSFKSPGKISMLPATLNIPSEATGEIAARILSQSGLWGMTTSVIQQKGPNPKDYVLHIKGDSQKYHSSGWRNPE